MSAARSWIIAQFMMAYTLFAMMMAQKLNPPQAEPPVEHAIMPLSSFAGKGQAQSKMVKTYICSYMM
jgi:hypothetical protein